MRASKLLHEHLIFLSLFFIMASLDIGVTRQDILRGDRLKGRESSSAQGASNLCGVNRHVSLRNFTAVGGIGAYLVKYGNKSLEVKNNLNEVIVTGTFNF